MLYCITACTSGWYKYVSYCAQYKPVLYVSWIHDTRCCVYCSLLKLRGVNRSRDSPPGDETNEKLTVDDVKIVPFNGK